MTTYKVGFKKTTGEVQVAAAVAAGFTDVGSVDVPDTDKADGLGGPDTHVLFHRVRDLLYKVGELDMQRVSITLNGTVVTHPDFITLTPNSVADLKVGATEEAYTFFSPEGTTDKSVTVTVADATICTAVYDGMNDNGAGNVTAKVKLTGVKVGSTTVTVKTVDGNLTAALPVTVIAA